MQAGIRHIIKTQTLEFHASDQDTARATQDKVLYLFKTKINALLNRLCQQYDVEDSLVKIESLELDLGVIPAGDLEEQLVRKIEKQFEEQLSKITYYLKTDSPHVRNTGQLISNRDAHLSDWFYFLKNGTLPWNSSTSLQALKVVFLDELKENPAEVSELLTDLLKDRSVRDRLLVRLDDDERLLLIRNVQWVGHKEAIKWIDHVTDLLKQNHDLPVYGKLIRLELFGTLLDLVSQSSAKFTADKATKLFLKHLTALTRLSAEKKELIDAFRKAAYRINKEKSNLSSFEVHLIEHFIDGDSSSSRSKPDRNNYEIPEVSPANEYVGAFTDGNRQEERQTEDLRQTDGREKSEADKLTANDPTEAKSKINEAKPITTDDPEDVQEKVKSSRKSKSKDDTIVRSSVRNDEKGTSVHSNEKEDKSNQRNYTERESAQRLVTDKSEFPEQNDLLRQTAERIEFTKLEAKGVSADQNDKISGDGQGDSIKYDSNLSPKKSDSEYRKKTLPDDAAASTSDNYGRDKDAIDATNIARGSEDAAGVVEGLDESDPGNHSDKKTKTLHQRENNDLETNKATGISGSEPDTSLTDAERDESFDDREKSDQSESVASQNSQSKLSKSTPDITEDELLKEAREKQRKQRTAYLEKRAGMNTPSVGDKQNFKAGDSSARIWKDRPKDLTEVFVDNAGLVLLTAFVPTLFKGLGYVENGEFVSEEMQLRGAVYLQYIATGEEQWNEEELVLNKLLVGLRPETVLPPDIVLTEEEKEEAEHLLEVVISNWTVLKGTKVKGLRSTFLLREGHLKKDFSGWKLLVHRTTLDVLLDKIPWSYSIIKMPWIKEMMYVEW